MTTDHDHPIRHNRQVYDQVAGQFARRNSGMSENMLRRIQGFLDRLKQVPCRRSPGPRLLDLGCGAGRDLAWFSGRVPALFGADFSAGMLREARAQVGAPLAQADMRWLPYAPGSFEGVWCVAALLHIPREEAPRVLREMRRILVPGGLLHLTVEKGEGEIWEPAPYDPPLERFYTRYQPEALAALLEGAGFDLIERGEEPGRRRWLWINARKSSQ